MCSTEGNDVVLRGSEAFCERLITLLLKTIEQVCLERKDLGGSAQRFWKELIKLRLKRGVVSLKWLVVGLIKWIGFGH